MYRVAVAIVRDSALAEDVVQEAIIKVWDHYGSFRGDAPLRAWVLRITRNVAISTLRTIRDEAWDPHEIPVAPMQPRAERQAVANDELDRLQIALAQLDELSRSILALRQIDDMPYEEIADTLGITVGQVKIRLLRARRKLHGLVRGGDP